MDSTVYIECRPPINNDNLFLKLKSVYSIVVSPNPNDPILELQLRSIIDNYQSDVNNYERTVEIRDIIASTIQSLTN